MIFFCLLLLLFPVNANYMTNNRIITKFKDKKKIINLFTNPNFYYKYLDIVEASDINFVPEIENLDSEVQFPQSISYYSTPKISFLPPSITKMKINQKWTRDKDIFYGHIRTKYLEFNITIEPILKNKHYLLEFKGTMIKKNFLIQEKYLDQLLEEFGDIFLQITEDEKC